METITIVGEWHGGMTVTDGRVKGARLHWQAPGLDVYLKSVPAKYYASACNLACNHAIALHIPARSLKRVGK